MWTENTLSRAQERQCAKLGWRNKLVENNMLEGVRYACHIAKGRYSPGEVASFVYDGLVQAFRNFDPARNRFFVWSKPFIRGKLFSAMRDQSRYNQMMGGVMPGGEDCKEDPETGVKEDMPRWVNEPHTDFDHEGVNRRLHYSEELHALMQQVLNDQERTTLTLRSEGLKFREIADRFGVTTSRAQAVYSAGLIKLRRALLRRGRLYE